MTDGKIKLKATKLPDQITAICCTVCSRVSERLLMAAEGEGARARPPRKKTPANRAHLNHSPPLRHGQYFSSIFPLLVITAVASVPAYRKCLPTRRFSHAAPLGITVVPIKSAFLALRSVP